MYYYLQIVPPNQAEMMYKAVKEKGIPTMHVLFEGEKQIQFKFWCCILNYKMLDLI